VEAAGRAAWLGLALVSAVVGTSAGCVRWVDIKPTELPKLNPAPAPDGTQVVVETIAHVERPDGKQVEISGPFHADVTTTGAGVMRFKHPVYSGLQNGTLVIEGGNRVQTPIPLADVTRVQVSQSSTGRTMLTVALAVGAGLLVIGLLRASFSGWNL
jgi:hypothetical protein